jgi:hypothetical protein
MIFDETKRLLAYIHGFDKRELSDLVAVSWTDVLEDIPFDDAKAAVKQFFLTPGHGYLEITDIIEAVQFASRQTEAQIEADVRVAKIKGIVPQEWPRSKALPPAEADALLTARKKDMHDLGLDQGEAPPPPPRRIEPPDFGTVGREVPRG